jgi:GINS complex subunit 1
MNDRLRREHARQGLPPPGREQLRTLADLPASEQVCVAAHAAAIRRNKRCVLAYLLYRLAKLRGVWWAVGGVQLSEEIGALLSEREKSTHHGYDQLLTAYMSATDLTLAAELKPPKDPHVDVRATRDRGDVVTEKSGVIQLRTDVAQRMHRSDAEQLIRQGLLVQAHDQ